MGVLHLVCAGVRRRARRQLAAGGALGRASGWPACCIGRSRRSSVSACCSASSISASAFRTELGSSSAWSAAPVLYASLTAVPSTLVGLLPGFLLPSRWCWGGARALPMRCCAGAAIYRQDQLQASISCIRFGAVPAAGDWTLKLVAMGVDRWRCCGRASSCWGRSSALAASAISYELIEVRLRRLLDHAFRGSAVSPARQGRAGPSRSRGNAGFRPRRRRGPGRSRTIRPRCDPGSARRLRSCRAPSPSVAASDCGVSTRSSASASAVASPGGTRRPLTHVGDHVGNAAGRARDHRHAVPNADAKGRRSASHPCRGRATTAADWNIVLVSAEARAPR